MNVELARVIEPKKQFDAAILFDNDQGQIAQVRAYCNDRSVTVVEVPDTPLEELGGEIRQISVDQLQIPWGSNAYVSMRNTKESFFGRTAGERYDARSGIEQPQIDLLKYWLITTRGLTNRVAIFDWDRTISKFEGVTLLEPELKDFKKPNGELFYSPERLREDTLIFIVGGWDRLRLLRQMFANLAENRVDIVILTNNVSCPNMKTYPFFYSLVKQLLADARFSIVCSLPYRGNKGLALQQTVLPQLCSVSRRDKSPTRK